MTGNQFKAFRKKHQLTQIEFADALGISRVTVYQQEKRGDKPVASEKMYVRMINDLERELNEK